MAVSSGKHVKIVPLENKRPSSKVELSVVVKISLTLLNVISVSTRYSPILQPFLSLQYRINQHFILILFLRLDLMYSFHRFRILFTLLTLGSQQISSLYSHGKFFVLIVLTQNLVIESNYRGNCLQVDEISSYYY